MRLCARVGAQSLLATLVLWTAVHVKAEQPQSKERHYYIAAVEIDWNYSGNETHRFSPTHKKVVFREYEKGFKQAKTHPSWLGLLGPTMRAEEGETIVVTFRNMASEPHSLHPHGIAYGKQSEGANYFDNTSLKEKEDDVVKPNSEYVYYWDVAPDVSPQSDDPTCLTYTYVSHRNVIEEYNSGLIGTLLICKPGSLDESGQQAAVHQELVFLFGVFDENESEFKPKCHTSDDHIKYTINGYTKGSLPDVSVCAHSSVSLHLVGMSSMPELFSVHMNGQVLQHMGHKVSSVGLISGSTATVSIGPLHTGRWLLSSHVSKHIDVGMYGFVDVKNCEGFKAPLRRMTIAQKRESREWKYFIAAEEVVWDYTPNVNEYIDEDYKLQYLTQSSTRIGARYKKAVYTLYSDETFTERMESKQRKNELGILGPVIRAQIRDDIKIVFKNMASRPYSIYPHGLTIEKSEEGVNYPQGGNQSHGVQPGETHTYVWRVSEDDEPMDADARCLTRMYHSAVDTPRDIASGLIGPMLICKSQSLNVRNVQLKADKEQHAMFAVFDENKSWYLDDNIRQYCNRSQVTKADPDFYKSNVMHSINGYVFESGPLLGFCNGEIATWHVSSIGSQDYIQTATVYGHPFKVNGRTEDILNLYPMTGETITMKMDNIGVWLLASLNSHETTKGMRVKFQDVECFRDSQYEYEYSDYDDPAVRKEFNLWKPPSLDDILMAETKQELTEETEKTTVEVDYYTDMFAEELGLRSLKNQSQDPDVEILNLSFLDFDDVDTTNVSTVMERKGENNTSPPKSNAQNWTEVNGVIPSEMDLSNQILIENITTTIHRSSKSVIDNITTDNHGELKNGNTASNRSTLGSVSNLINVTAAETKNKTLRNDMLSLIFGNISTEMTILTLALPETTNHTVTVPETTNHTVTVPETTNHTVTLPETTNHTVTVPETTNHTVTVPETLTGNLSSVTEADKLATTQTSNQNILDSRVELEERLTRGDVFFYSVPPSPPSTDNLGTTEGNLTARNHVNRSTNGTNQTMSIQLAALNISSFDRQNISFDLKSMSNATNVKNTLISPAELGQVPQRDLSWTTSSNFSDEFQTLPSLPNVTVAKSNVTGDVLTGSDSWEEFTYFPGKSNQTSSVELSSNSSSKPGNLLHFSGPVKDDLLEELSASYSSEEVLIYLKENDTEGIKTTAVKTQGHSWTYEGTHKMVPMENPDHMKKYLEKETTPTKASKIRRVSYRQRPPKGQGMKTKRRKEYKPQVKSGLPFSPRGFYPGVSPRGSRPVSPQPVSDEEELINMPVVIGVPRPDFSNYELYVPGDEPDHLVLDEQDVKANEYEYVSYKDPYGKHEDIRNFNVDETTKYYLANSGPNVKTYFISAEEVMWDYIGYGQRRQEKMQQYGRETKFTKVVFRSYMDSNFRTPDIRGELDEHLGILGPVIKAEVGQSLMVVFRNNARRPYSLHPNGVSYTKWTEGLSYEDGSKYWYKYDNEVQPNTTFTYIWKVSSTVGPTSDESLCRTWAYYSGVNPERDIHSGLIGPLLVCREGTLNKTLINTREFTLLFMTFDESQSWYYEKNVEMIQRKKRRKTVDSNFKENLKFHSINGIIYNLKGLRMYTKQIVYWHLINMGSPKDFQTIHFHGQTFLHKKTTSYRQAVYPLLPGGFATLEMYPSKPGLWQLETEVGVNQNKGMQTLFLVLDNDCYRPLGLQSGSVKDKQMTAVSTRGYWEPHLARLNNNGKYNAWSTEQNNSWIQVDFQRPVVISQVATQGAKQLFYSQFVNKYYISYSNDRRMWTFYKGDSRYWRKVFSGNQEAYETKTNTFFPPVIGRFIRLHPISWYNKATVRMEFYGCELDGCSVPLGMESRLIEDQHITASSTASSWYSGPWKASLARLNKQGTINAWQAKHMDMGQWLRVELPEIRKITGIITQGARSLGKEMYVTSYTLQYSNDGMHWNQYTDDAEDQPSKIFPGNTDNNGHVKNYIFPPIFSRFIQIHPKSWVGSITMRVELLGCDFE